MRTARPHSGKQRGVALITSLLLLLIITILALSMFRSFSSLEKIAGNMREKDRAVHAAVSAQQFAEWWLTQPAAVADTTTPVSCAAGPPLIANPPASEGQVCSTQTSLVNLIGVNNITQQLPWPVTYLQYLPPGSTVGQVGPNGDAPYALTPGFYISDLGASADAEGEVYQIDAFSSGATTSTIAVVESIYELQQGIVNRGGL
ncbi:MAG TPA: PilX N-terminal domain-containing pilus assembly protein [Mycobacterium sp.]|nr:PilX N-terminal domain-containing pilus assembly protein [Mycobacterium sp.]HUH69228.1 PilX N-terminal domain-containing pilus assembly protein [Mycobacterium sp.]